MKPTTVGPDGEPDQQDARPLPSFTDIGEGPDDLSARYEELLDELTDPEWGWE